MADKTVHYFNQTSGCSEGDQSDSSCFLPYPEYVEFLCSLSALSMINIVFLLSASGIMMESLPARLTNTLHSSCAMFSKR